MSNADIRKAHKLLDYVSQGRAVLDDEIKLLRSFLPERPKDAKLVDLLDRVHAAWLSANPSDWGFDTPAEHHDWLFDLRNDLVRIIEEQDTPATVPALPAGMRIADHAVYGRVITSPKPNRNGVYDLLIPKPKFETGADWEYAHECELTFIDAEPTKPARPEFLETEADYQNAPEGTIVAKDSSGSVCVKTCLWPDMMVLTVKRRVLRWGWGE